MFQRFRSKSLLRVKALAFQSSAYHLSLLSRRVVRSRALAVRESINERKRNGSHSEALTSWTPEFVCFKVWETLHEAPSQDGESASKSRTPWIYSGEVSASGSSGIGGRAGLLGNYSSSHFPMHGEVMSIAVLMDRSLANRAYLLDEPARACVANRTVPRHRAGSSRQFCSARKPGVPGRQR